jgi:hypothetical protein
MEQLAALAGVFDWRLGDLIEETPPPAPRHTIKNARVLAIAERLERAKNDEMLGSIEDLLKAWRVPPLSESPASELRAPQAGTRRNASNAEVQRGGRGARARPTTDARRRRT